MGGFVCAGCGRSVTNPYEQYLERIEYVRQDRKERRHVRVLRALCVGCVEKEHAPEGEQESLL